MASLGDEPFEAFIRHGQPIDPKPINGDAVDGSFLWIVLVRAHSKRATRHPDHIRKRRRPWCDVAISVDGCGDHRSLRAHDGALGE
jgi:hypothetical protein